MKIKAHARLLKAKIEPTLLYDAVAEDIFTTLLTMCYAHPKIYIENKEDGLYIDVVTYQWDQLDIYLDRLIKQRKQLYREKPTDMGLNEQNDLGLDQLQEVCSVLGVRGGIWIPTFWFPAWMGERLMQIYPKSKESGVIFVNCPQYKEPADMDKYNYSTHCCSLDKTPQDVVVVGF